MRKNVASEWIHQNPSARCTLPFVTIHLHTHSFAVCACIPSSSAWKVPAIWQRENSFELEYTFSGRCLRTNSALFPERDIVGRIREQAGFGLMWTSRGLHTSPLNARAHDAMNVDYIRRPEYHAVKLKWRMNYYFRCTRVLRISLRIFRFACVHPFQKKKKASARDTHFITDIGQL